MSRINIFGGETMKSRGERRNYKPILAVAIAFIGTAGLALAFSLGVATADKPKENILSHAVVTPGAETTTATVSASAEPTYTVFRLDSPNRLIIDVAEGNPDSLQSPQEFDNGHILNFTTALYKNGDRSIARLIFGLAPESQYEVKAEKDRILVNVKGVLTADRMPKLDSSTSKVAQNDESVKEEVAKTVPVAQSTVAEPTKEEKAEESTAVIRLIENLPAELESVKVADDKGGPMITIKTDPVLDTFESLQVEDPPRLVVDLPNTKKDAKIKDFVPKSKFVKKVRFGAHGDNLRVVFDLSSNKRLVGVVKPWNNEIAIALSSESNNVAVASATPANSRDETEVVEKEVVNASQPTSEPVKKEDKAVSSAKESIAKKEEPVKIQNVSFSAIDSETNLTIALSKNANYRVLKKGERVKILEIDNVVVPDKWRKSLDTTAQAGPVSMVSIFETKDKSKARIVLNLRDDVQQTLTPRGNELVWKLSGVNSTQQNLYAGKALESFAARTAQEDAGVSPKEEGTGKKYRGKRISLDFKDADIGNILRLIADVSKLNIIASDDVKGKITVTLKNVPWDEALDIILRSKGLGQERRGNILRVAPLEVLQKEKELEAQALIDKEKAQPLKVRLIPVNYASAGEIASQVKDMLSDRGSISIDARTNVLIVKDISDNLYKAEKLVRHLDTQTPQVLIEARIVEANAQTAYAFGIQWGGKFAAAPGTNNETGLAFPNVVSIGGGADDARTNSELSGTLNPGNFVVNMPAPVGAGSGGALGMIFGSAGGAALLSLRLSAMEQEGSIKVVSSPRITTLDNKTASIEQGVSIPISQVSSAGVQTIFVNATLKLEVTPHVTADGSVLMVLKISNNQPDFGRTGAQGDPTILKEQAETEMLVRDGDTAVIGGIFVRRTGVEHAGVPLFSRLPILGILFKRDSDRDERAELLIFITPRIVNRNQSFISST